MESRFNEISSCVERKQKVRPRPSRKSNDSTGHRLIDRKVPHLWKKVQ